MRNGVGTGSKPRGRRQPPSVVAEFHLGGSITDIVHGYAMAANLPAVNGKYVERFGDWVGFGANQPRINGTALVLSGGQTNVCACVKYDPQEGDTSIFSLGNSPDFDIEDMTESLAGSPFRLFAGNAYHLSTVSSGVWGQVTVPGSLGVVGDATIAVAVLAPHGVKVYTNDGSSNIDIPASSEWQLVKIDNITTVQTWAKMVLRLEGSGECWFILPHLLNQKRFESLVLGDNTAAPASFPTEAGAADNGISYDFANNPELAAILGKLVVDGNGNVRTPTGDEQLADTPAWTVAGGWSESATNTLSGTVAAWSNASKAILTVGKAVIVEYRAIVNSGSFRVQGGNDVGPEISASGTYVAKVTPDSVALRCLALASGFEGEVIFESVKPVEAEGHIHWEGTFGFDKGDNSAIFAPIASTSSAPYDILYVNTSGDFKTYDGLTVASVSTPNYLAGDHLEADVYYSYKTGKFRVDVTHNGTTYTGTEADFKGWPLTYDKIIQMWGDIDGLSVTVGPEQSYIEGVA